MLRLHFVTLPPSGHNLTWILEFIYHKYWTSIIRSKEWRPAHDHPEESAEKIHEVTVTSSLICSSVFCVSWPETEAAQLFYLLKQRMAYLFISKHTKSVLL